VAVQTFTALFRAFAPTLHHFSPSRLRIRFGRAAPAALKVREPPSSDRDNAEPSRSPSALVILNARMAGGSSTRALSRVVNIDDLRDLARRRVPRIVFDYIDGGADAEFTLRENTRAFDQVTFRPRQAVPLQKCDLRTRVLDAPLSMPLMLAPVGYCRIMHPDGEVAAARSAGDAGTAYILSTVSGHRLEDVKSASAGPVWFQLYLTGGRAAAENAMRRAEAVGYTVLVVTIDTTVIGLRERESRDGMEQLLRGSFVSKIRFTPQLFARPRWLLKFLLDGGLPDMPNIVNPEQGVLKVKDAHTALKRIAFNWGDMPWIRAFWKGPIVVKGILTAEDAQRALDQGAAAVVVSNHGGRQLDGTPATLQVLPKIVAAVNGRAEVLLDSGIRRGSDVVKAICLGARAVLCGRAYAYGLAADGEVGVTRALEILRADLERTLRLLGCGTVHELNSSYVDVPRSWRVD
jgi:isopentenyl diphosphate isomerase/L-lactate dehydrogenase-like FMN-dependent dehydrogenase